MAEALPSISTLDFMILLLVTIWWLTCHSDKFASLETIGKSIVRSCLRQSRCAVPYKFCPRSLFYPAYIQLSKFMPMRVQCMPFGGTLWTSVHPYKPRVLLLSSAASNRHIRKRTRCRKRASSSSMSSSSRVHTHTPIFLIWDMFQG
ncbi:hypothetical protein V8C44DRAFT_353360 [Trichoderma aethiopicum]